ncbi:hypothetical protein DB31_0622 [Hyalangium minutum]|uniref:Uncharacterized protein n=1 Tax=Hyalangium minutum TaxID=394096 RepID=A0A085WXE7_9BACT|nr:hypothetical protein DB31_0622 [Hyalangium minutum]
MSQTQPKGQECVNEELDANHRRPSSPGGEGPAYNVHRSGPARIGDGSHPGLGHLAVGLEARAPVHPPAQ